MRLKKILVKLMKLLQTNKTKSAFNRNYIEYESKGVKDKNLSPSEYLDIIRPYLSNVINDHKTMTEWKIQLTLQINFISHRNSEKFALCLPRAVK